MNVEQAILEVCQRFCSATGDAHDDACVALRRSMAQIAAVRALADRADARADVERRLVTTIALRAAIAESRGVVVMGVDCSCVLVEPWAHEMGGFEGCTDINPDVCACATDSPTACRICGQEIEPGEQVWSRQWPCYDTLPLDHKDQDWDVISWHDDCPDERTPDAD